LPIILHQVLCLDAGSHSERDLIPQKTPRRSYESAKVRQCHLVYRCVDYCGGNAAVQIARQIAVLRADWKLAHLGWSELFYLGDNPHNPELEMDQEPDPGHQI